MSGSNKARLVAFVLGVVFTFEFALVMVQGLARPRGASVLIGRAAAIGLLAGPIIGVVACATVAPFIRRKNPVHAALTFWVIANLGLFVIPPSLTWLGSVYVPLVPVMIALPFIVACIATNRILPDVKPPASGPQSEICGYNMTFNTSGTCRECGNPGRGNSKRRAYWVVLYAVMEPLPACRIA